MPKQLTREQLLRVVEAHRIGELLYNHFELGCPQRINCEARIIERIQKLFREAAGEMRE